MVRSSLRRLLAAGRRDATAKTLATLRSMPPVPRLPGVPDPLRRINVPADLEPVTAVGPEDDPWETGISIRSARTMWRAAESLYRTGVHPAVQLCVRRRGRIVVNRAIGHARGNGPADQPDAERVKVGVDTPFTIFSTSKAVTAMLVHLLDERGMLHIADPVAEYLPEYAVNGKESITISQLLSHRAGVPNLPSRAFDLDLLYDTEAVVEILCDAKPYSRPGKQLAYHAISGGFILGEVVRRVTGRPLRDVLAAEILAPLGFRWMNYGVAESDVPRVALNYATGLPLLPPLSTRLEKALGKPADEVTELSNDPRFLTGIVPAGNVVTTADELSRFFELLLRGGELDGVRIFEPRTLRRALTEQSYLEIDHSLGFPTRFSYGMMLGAKVLSIFGPGTERAFGHLGFTNILGWADPERDVSCALITSGKPVVYPELARFWEVGWRIGRDVPKGP